MAVGARTNSIAKTGGTPVVGTWTIRNSDGNLLPEFACNSRLEVGRKVLPTRYDTFRLHVSPSYRELFDRAVRKVLERQAWQIVRMSRQHTQRAG